MRSRDRKVGNYVAYGRSSNGYLKTCRDCSRTIYIHYGNGRWRPYESWTEGDAAQGEFIPHDCPAAGSDIERKTPSSRDNIPAILAKYLKVSE